MPVKIEELSKREVEILRLIEVGSSDREIASKLFLSLNTVKWHNRQIYAKLDVSSRTAALAAAAELGLLDAEPALKARLVSRVPTNLPAPVSSFVGREKEIREITELLGTQRLVTLTGPGGVGKTRLALQSARELLPDGSFPDGIFLIELAPVREPERVVEAILEGLNLQASADQSIRERLQQFLDDRSALLVLDNYEHLLAAAPLVTDLLQSSPRLRILATSREVLSLSGEQVYSVPPLNKNASRTLFIQRAGEVRQEFSPAQQDLLMIDQICARLDHLPLAIELAAARVKIFYLKELLDQLADRFSLLTQAPRDAPERHQTLGAAIDWSYNLLEEEEQILFRRLAVFQGSRTIDAVQEVGCFDLGLDALDGLESFLTKNLLKQEEGFDGEARFYLLETLHEYARERLQESGEEDEIRQRHAEYFVNLVTPLFGPNFVFWLKRLEADFENFRQVQAWTSSQGKDELRLQLNHGFYGFWRSMGHHQEGKEWIESALEIVGDSSLLLQAGVYIAAANIFSIVGEFDRSLECSQKAFTRYQELGEKRYLGLCHRVIIEGLARMDDPDEEIIMEHFQSAVKIYSEMDFKGGLSHSWGVLAIYYENIGNEELTYESYKKALLFAREGGEFTNICWFSVMVAMCELKRGNARLAKEMLLEVLAGEYAHFKSHVNIEWTIELLAGPELALGHPRRAVTLLAAGNALRSLKGGDKTLPEHEVMLQKTMDLAGQQLDQAAFEKAWAEGQSMSFDEVVAFALEGAET